MENRKHPYWPLLMTFTMGAAFALASGCGLFSGGQGGEGGAGTDSLDNIVSYHNHEMFPITTSTVHFASCNNCHKDYNAFANFSCLGCHVHTEEKMAAVHNVVSGYQYDSQSCFSCHPEGMTMLDGNLPSGGHDLIFPTGAGSVHEALSCSTCHVNPNNRKEIDCTTCHDGNTTSPLHANVGGYQATSSACLDCHHSSQVNRVAQHTPFLINNGMKHFKKSCRKCHETSLTTKPFEATDFSFYACAPCHDPNKKTHFAQPQNSCLTCHPNGKKD